MPLERQLYQLTGEERLSLLDEDFEVDGNFMGKLEGWKYFYR
jgi:hypothetical protein